MPADLKKIVHRRVADLKPADYNPRQLTEKQFADIRTSIERFGFVDPLVVNKHPDRADVIVGGHQRWRVAQAMGLEKVPTVEVSLDMAQERELNVRLNRNVGEWDWDALANNFDMGELKDWGFLQTDFDLFWPDDPTTSPTGVDPDDIPAPPDEAVTKHGDLWVLGDHRLLCGDSSSPEDVARLLDGAVIHLVNTDPPYNVNVEPRSNNAIAAGSNALPPSAKAKVHLQKSDLARLPGKSKPTHSKLRPKDRPLMNDFMTAEDFGVVLLQWFGNLSRSLVPGGSFYIWGGFANWANYCAALEASGLYFSQGITWVKDHPVLGRKDFMNDCEHAWYGWKLGAGHKFYGPNNARNVWNVKKVNPTSMIHITEKPVELAVRAMQYSSRPGEHVLDLFGGSGSTMIAAEQTGRRAFLMELDPLYCDVIVQRYEKFSGKKATRLEPTSPTCDAVAAG